MKGRTINSARWAASLVAAVLAIAAATSAQAPPAVAAAVAASTKPRTVPVFGVVRDLDGSPVAGATVHSLHEDLAGCGRLVASRLGVGRRFGATTQTNAKGRFVLKVAATGSFGIVASDGGNTRRSQVFAPAAPAGQHELILRPTVKVRGRFVDVDTATKQESPVTARIVRAFGPVRSAIPSRPAGMQSLSVIDEVTTDDEGHFEILTLQGVPCRLEDRWRTCRLELADTASNATDRARPLQLRRECVQMRGVIVDNETEAPIPHAEVLNGGTTLRAGPDGSYSVYAPTSTQTFFTARGYRATVGDRKQQGGTIRMVATDVARLTVTDAHGQPATAAEIVACQIASSERASAVLMRRLTTDGSGQLRISRPAKYGVTLFANCSGRLMRIAEVLGGSGDVRIACSLAGHRVAGTVLGIDGIPAAHVPIYASPTETALGSRWPLAAEPVAYTDHAGKFSTPPLADLEYALASRSQRSAVAFTQPFRPARGSSGRQNLELQAAPIIGGTVYDAAGKPCAGATVVARPIGKRDRRIDQFGLWFSKAVSDSQGHYQLPLTNAEADHIVSARHVDEAGVFHRTQAETVRETEHAVDLRIQ